MFGCWNNRLFINPILFLGKRLIYQCRCNKFVPNLALLIAKLKYTCKIEEQIARSKINFQSTIKMGDTCTFTLLNNSCSISFNSQSL